MQQWYHIVAAYHKGDNIAYLYVNGQLHHSYELPTFYHANSSHPLYIGCDDNNNSMFHGLVAELAAYSTCLSLDDIIAHYNFNIADWSSTDGPTNGSSLASSLSEARQSKDNNGAAVTLDEVTKALESEESSSSIFTIPLLFLTHLER